MLLTVSIQAMVGAVSRTSDTLVQLHPAACLFDLDGLLLDTEPLHGQAWRQAARHHGGDLGAAQLLQLRGRRRADCASQVSTWLLSSTGVEVAPQALLAVQQPIARSLLPGAKPIDGARQLLECCRDHSVPAAMVTSSSMDAASIKIGHHPWIDQLLPLRVHGDDPELSAGKPAPDPCLLAARRLGVEPARCWAFEDSLAGARSAAAAGCKVVVLLDGDLPPPGLPEGCRIVHSLTEVLVK